MVRDTLQYGFNRLDSGRQSQPPADDILAHVAGAASRREGVDGRERVVCYTASTHVQCTLRRHKKWNGCLHRRQPRDPRSTLHSSRARIVVEGDARRRIKGNLRNDACTGLCLKRPRILAAQKRTCGARQQPPSSRRRGHMVASTRRCPTGSACWESLGGRRCRRVQSCRALAKWP